MKYSEIVDTIGSAEQINEHIWKEEVVTLDQKRWFVVYEFSDEEIAEAKKCDDPTQFEDFLPWDEDHVFGVEEV